MSTILDALKKSEQERKLNSLPTLSDMAAPHEPARWPTVLLLIATILLFVLLVLVVKLLWFAPQPDDLIAVNGAPAEQGVVNETLGDESLVPQGIVVSVVSYSESPSKRFIMIDGKLLRENEFVRAGLKVEEIRQNEVVLNLRGRRLIKRP